MPHKVPTFDKFETFLKVTEPIEKDPQQISLKNNPVSATLVEDLNIEKIPVHFDDTLIEIPFFCKCLNFARMAHT